MDGVEAGLVTGFKNLNFLKVSNRPHPPFIQSESVTSVCCLAAYSILRTEFQYQPQHMPVYSMFGLCSSFVPVENVVL